MMSRVQGAALESSSRNSSAASVLSCASSICVGRPRCLSCLRNCATQVCTAAAFGVAARMRIVIGVCVFPEAARSASQSLGGVESFSDTTRCVCSRVPVSRWCCACCVAIRVAEGGDQVSRDAPGCGLPACGSGLGAGAAVGAAREVLRDITSSVVAGALAAMRSIRNDGSCDGAGNAGNTDNSAAAAAAAAAGAAGAGARSVGRGAGALLSMSAAGAPLACTSSLFAVMGAGGGGGAIATCASSCVGSGTVGGWVDVIPVRRAEAGGATTRAGRGALTGAGMAAGASSCSEGAGCLSTCCAEVGLSADAKAGRCATSWTLPSEARSAPSAAAGRAGTLPDSAAAGIAAAGVSASGTGRLACHCRPTPTASVTDAASARGGIQRRRRALRRTGAGPMPDGARVGACVDEAADAGVEPCVEVEAAAA